jgi:hypothetical protein
MSVLGVYAPAIMNSVPYIMIMASKATRADDRARKRETPRNEQSQRDDEPRECLSTHVLTLSTNNNTFHRRVPQKSRQR